MTHTNTSINKGGGVGRVWHFWRIKRLAAKLEHHQRKVKV